jgi:phosphatidate cytidylyltransferase
LSGVPEAMDRASLSNMEWPARALFALVLAGLALGSTLAGAPYLALVIGALGWAAAREWHRMVSPAVYLWETIFSGAAITGSLAALVIAPHGFWAVGILLAGSLLAGATAWFRKAQPVLNGMGALYIGLPSLSVVALRMHSNAGAFVVIALFIVIWAADTGALLTGRVLGGPKLVPALSPNKTWAGFAGGLVLPAAGLAIYVTLLHGTGWKAAVLGASLALAAHAGDLFESWIKRRVGRKNSGSLIPGHGGVLDRIDSTLFAAPVAFLLIVGFGLDPLFGGHP